MTSAPDRLDRLLAVRRESAERLEDLARDHEQVVAASRDSNADDEHDPEGATIAFERAQLDAVADQLRRHLDEVDAAIARVRSGDDGVCERCGEAIGEARLAVRPTATRCIRCAS